MIDELIRGSLSYLFLLPDFLSVVECFHRRAAAAHFALMGPFSIVGAHPDIKIALQRFDVSVELLAEGHLVELLQNGFMEALANTVRLR